MAHVANTSGVGSSSAGLKKHRTLNGKSAFPNEDYFLAFFIDEEVLQILYIRVMQELVKDQAIQV